MAAGRFAEACPKLAESFQLEPAGGTLLNLALCHKQEGKTATAWTEFQRAAAMARRDQRPDREEAATKEAAELEPRLSRLELVVPEAARVDGLQILLDGTAVPAQAWGIATPVDPGKRRIVVKAPGHRSVDTTVDVAAAASARYEVPRLAPSASSAAPAKPATPTGPTRDAATDTGSTQRTLAWIAGGLGVAGLAVGTVTGIMVLGKQSDADDICDVEACRRDQTEAVDLNEQAHDLATVSNIGFGVGILGIGVATVLLLTAPKRAAALDVRSEERRVGEGG